MKCKKIVSSILLFFSFFMLFGENLNAENERKVFNDVEKSFEFFSAIVDLKDSGIVEGYTDGSYKPENSINRAEFLKILIMSIQEDFGGNNCFPDVKDEWFAPYVCKAKELGLVSGYDDGFFRPERDINFAEVAKIVSNAFDLIQEKSDKNIWFKHYVLSLQDYSAIPTSILSFDKKINRAEMAEIIYRVKNGYTQKAYNTFESISRGEVAKIDTVSLQNFRSCEEMNAYFSRPSFGSEKEIFFEESPSFSGDFFEQATEDSAMNESVSRDKFSETNVQVEGVDEGDIVKTDGKFIYVLKGNTVRVVDAVPANNMKEINFVGFSDDNFYPSDMYVSGNRLVVMGSYYGIIPMPYLADDMRISVMPPRFSEQISNVYVFDISNKNDIKLIRETEVEGTIVSSRKIANTVYLLTNKTKYLYYPYDYDPLLVPAFKDSALEDESSFVANCNEVSYIPGMRDSSSFTTVFAIPVDDASKEVALKTVVSSSGQVYSSLDNLYLAESRYQGDFRIMGDIFAGEEKTIVHKFALSPEKIEYKGNGSVSGVVLNQFSMDEKGNDFRIATSTNQWSSINSSNNLYVLDDSLRVIGKIEGIAPGERIYSARFMGDRAYMVTFREVDPFYVIDLKDSRNPKILGELKLPGFSNYLHPYDENHIIGFGKDTAEVDSQFWTGPLHQGMKIAMFDVSDVSNPKLKHQELIGDRGTYSDLLYNHKALLFDKEKGIMAFPISVYEIEDSIKIDPNKMLFAYGDIVFQGAYFYKISSEKGFEFKGKISHFSDAELNSNDKYVSLYGDKQVDRVLYIGDTFYSVSKALVKANKMLDLTYVSEAKLGGNSGSYWDFWY